MRALCVFSGGLDSMLAAELIRAQGVEVLGLFFETPFFTAGTAGKSARSMGLPFKVVDITQRHLEVVRHPKHGYGGNMNPCIDCHALMFRIAGEMLRQEKASFVFTGEVLGQRPMSQNRQSLSLIAFESNLNDLLVRPLSAKLLPITIPEREGWVKRDLLMRLNGRSRKPQMELAEKLNVKGYPAPAGGCLLTDKLFSRRLKDLMLSNDNLEPGEIEALKLGRHFRIGPGTKLVVGRNKKENEAIQALSRENDLILTAISAPGPTVLVSGVFSDSAVDLAAAITLSYSDVEEGMTCPVRVTGKEEKILEVMVSEKEKFRRYMI